MSSPTPGSTLTSSSATFSWTAGSGVSSYWLMVGNNGAGSANILSQGGAQRTRTVTGLPASGTLNVRLMSYIGSGWQFNDYTYTMNAAVKAVMTWPTPGSVITNPWASFSWTAAQGASSYWLLYRHQWRRLGKRVVDGRFGDDAQRDGPAACRHALCPADDLCRRRLAVQ